MTNLLVMEIALYILLLSFYMYLALNNTILSLFRSSSISYLSILCFAFYSHAYLMNLNYDSNLVMLLSSMVGYLLSLCPHQNFQQNSEIILLISWRIFELRNAPVASTPKKILLTSSLDFPGLHQPWLPPFFYVKSFGIWMCFALTMFGLSSVLCLGSLFGTTMCLSRTKRNLPSFHTVCSVAMWSPRELVFVGVRNQASVNTFHGHLSLDAYCRLQILRHWKLFHISSGLKNLTEWNMPLIASVNLDCFLFVCCIDWKIVTLRKALCLEAIRFGEGHYKLSMDTVPLVI